MRQYINLLGPAFRKQRLLLTLDRAVMLAGLALVVMVGVQAYSRQQVEGVREELASARGLLKAQSAYTDRLKGEGAAKKTNTGLDVEVQRLETELKAARDSMGVLEGSALGNRDGFAQYLQAFSRQAMDGLWLTGFSVSSGEVAIEGRVVRPELVPLYIQKLNSEPALKGREFSGLEVRRPLPVPATGPVKDIDAAKAATPRFLEFVLTTGEPVAEIAGGKR